MLGVKWREIKRDLYNKSGNERESNRERERARERKREREKGTPS